MAYKTLETDSRDWNCPEQKPMSCCVEAMASESLNKGDKLLGIDLISEFESLSSPLFMSSSLLSDNKTNLCFFFLENSISQSKRIKINNIKQQNIKDKQMFKNYLYYLLHLLIHQYNWVNYLHHPNYNLLQTILLHHQ